MYAPVIIQDRRETRYIMYHPWNCFDSRLCDDTWGTGRYHKVRILHPFLPPPTNPRVEGISAGRSGLYSCNKSSSPYREIGFAALTSPKWLYACLPPIGSRALLFAVIVARLMLMIFSKSDIPDKCRNDGTTADWSVRHTYVFLKRSVCGRHSCRA